MAARRLPLGLLVPISLLILVVALGALQYRWVGQVSEAERAQWVNHRLYRIVESLTAQADVAFTGIGDIGPKCPLHVDGFITAAEVADLAKRGAVAEMLGLPIDANGNPVQSPTRRRVTSVTLDSPPKRPTIGFAGGERKHGADHSFDDVLQHTRRRQR